MTFKTYLDILTNIYKDNPELRDKKVIYGVDSEGNAFMPVVYAPSFGTLDDTYFEAKTKIDKSVNAVCLN